MQCADGKVLFNTQQREAIVNCKKVSVTENDDSQYVYYMWEREDESILTCGGKSLTEFCLQKTINSPECINNLSNFF